jgi:hypothetical protein
MTTPSAAAAATTTGPITLDDVRAALADTSPASTNAGALRRILGRGSNATIQNHLNTIRAELVPVAPVAPGAAPAAPAEALAAIWSASYAAAQVLTLGRLEAVTAQREQLAGTVAQQAQDLSAALDQVDAMTDAATLAAGNATAAAAQQAQELARVQAEASAAVEALQGTRSALERAQADAAHAAQLAERDAQIAAQAMQNTIDRLNDQVSELKSLLIVRTTPVAEAKKA